jgi:hypothetical protein
VDYNILRTELTTDPLERGYAGMTNEQAADSLNTANRATTRSSVPTWEVLEATVSGEYDTLSTANKTRYQIFISAGELDPSKPNTRAAFAAMFAANTQTRANLLALAAGDPISRAAELGLERIEPGHVARVRAGGS